LSLLGEAMNKETVLTFAQVAIDFFQKNPLCRELMGSDVGLSPELRIEYYPDSSYFSEKLGEVCGNKRCFEIYSVDVEECGQTYVYVPYQCLLLSPEEVNQL